MAQPEPYPFLSLCNHLARVSPWFKRDWLDFLHGPNLLDETTLSRWLLANHKPLNSRGDTPANLVPRYLQLAEDRAELQRQCEAMIAARRSTKES